MVSWKEARVEHGLTFKVSSGKVQAKLLGVEEVAGSLMEGQVGNTIQLEVCLW